MTTTATPEPPVVNKGNGRQVLQEDEEIVAERAARKGRTLAPRDTEPISTARRLRECRYWIASVALLAGAITAYAFVRDPVMYRSSVLLFLNGSGFEEQQVPYSPSMRSAGMSRLQHLATSSDVMDKLIRDHALYKHYDLDTTDLLYHEQAVDRLSGNVEVQLIDPNSMSITVKDLDRVKAMQLANALFAELRNTLQLQDEAYLNRQVLFHRDLLRFHEAQTNKRKAELIDLAAQFRNRDQDRLSERKNLPPNSMDLRLVEASAGFAEASNDLQSQGQLMEQMAALSRKGPLSDLILMKRAMLDTTTQPRLTIVLSVLGGMAIGALLCALSVVVWSQEGHWLRELFGG